jgi:hypothetical protein
VAAELAVQQRLVVAEELEDVVEQRIVVQVVSAIAVLPGVLVLVESSCLLRVHSFE